MLFTTDSAKQFLLTKVSDQAAHDGVPLDDIEKRMFLFSETSGSTDFEANEIFDEKYDDKAYEAKVTKLLRRAYAHDKRTEEAKDEWKEALKALKHEDFYGLVMVDQAGIPRSQESLWAFELKMLPFEIVELSVLAFGFLLVFRPAVLGLYLADWVRWLAYPLFLWLFWYVGRVFSRIQTTKAAKQSRSTDR